MNSDAGVLSYGFFVQDDTPSKGYSCVTRSMYEIGTPLAGYENAAQLGDEQFSEVEEKWLDEQVEPGLWGYFGMKEGVMGQSPYMEQASIADLDVAWYSLLLQNKELYALVAKDQGFMFLSIIFVWVWLMVHTGSFFVGSIGMLQIFLSLPVSMFLYYAVLRITFFETLQTLVIFVVLGVGADDVFVLVDAWKQSASEVVSTGAMTTATVPPGGSEAAQELHCRMKYAFSRALQAVFNTSFTTAMAFFATATSPIMPICESSAC